MRYAVLGDTGLIVSRLAFGAMTFTAGNRQFAGVYKTEAAEADALVGRALDAGINFFDTADGYAGGQSEEMLGRALAGRRDELVIATKVGFRSGAPLTQAGLSRRHILWSIDQSLKRLGTDHVDLYIAHRDDPRTRLEDTLAALDAVVRAGKARYLGFSNWPAWKVAASLELQRANGWARFTHGQMYYSLLGRDIERDIVPTLAHYALGLTVWSPLAGGFLSGKYRQDAPADADSRLAGDFNILPLDRAAGFALVEQMRGIAQAHDVSVAQLALAWLLAKPAVTSIIVGASKREQLDDNLRAADLVLDADTVAALDAATPLAPVYPHWFAERLADATAAQALAPPANSEKQPSE